MGEWLGESNTSNISSMSRSGRLPGIRWSVCLLASLFSA